MLRRSARLLMEAVQNNVKTNSGCVTKALSTDKLVVKHDDVNQMFYIQLDTGMDVTSQYLSHN
jgi:hypothetical protein